MDRIMQIAVNTNLAEMNTFIGRFAKKTFDWDAFPASRSFPDLARAQMRYIGAGGAYEKVGDLSTLQPGAFTLSIVTQMPGKYAAAHAHECKEAFLGLSGQLTVGWVWDDEVIEATLSAKDMCLNDLGRPHGFRNDGVGPVVCSIMVGTSAPLPPHYTCHPRDSEEEVARHFGAKPGKYTRLDPLSNDPRHQEFARHVVRYSQQKPIAHSAGFSSLTYIGDGGAPPEKSTMHLIHLPRGSAVNLYEREVEDVFFTLEGVVTAGWLDKGRIYEERLGPKDMIFNPPGRAHYFRNDGLEDAQFMMVIGSPNPEHIQFMAA